MSKKSMAYFAMLAGAVGASVYDALEKHLDARPKKHCLHCGGEHYHNNSFCSASCCRAYRADKRKKR